jgi:hypothetical protein
VEVDNTVSGPEAAINFDNWAELEKVHNIIVSILYY